MTQIFRKKWLRVVKGKNSVLCAGLDPAEFDMNRGENGLPGGVRKGDWATQYILAVAPYCAAVKFNTKYWNGKSDSNVLTYLVELTKAHGLIVIDDSKLADTTDSNEAGISFSKKAGFDAVTLAPFAGNMKGTADLCRQYKIAGITMCLMSNPEFKREKGALIEASDNLHRIEDLIEIEGRVYVQKYIQLAHDAFINQLEGIVVGAPSKENHISNQELEKVAGYANDGKMLVLSPGLGYQQGEAESLFRYFGKNNVIASVSRNLMFPRGSFSTPKQQAEAAKNFKEMLNKSRTA